MQERLRECYIKEGVNHLENCKDLREALWKKIHTPNYGAPGPPKHVRRATAARAPAPRTAASTADATRAARRRRAPPPRTHPPTPRRAVAAELQVYVSGLRLRGTDAGASRVVEARYVEKCDDSRPAGRSHLWFTASVGRSVNCRRSMLSFLASAPTLARPLTLIESTGHVRHRPPPGQPHLEVPERLHAAKAALQAAPFAEEALAWREAVDAPATAEDAVAALKLVHTIDHLRGLVEMSKTGGGFDTDTYCAPGSWEAMLDGTRAWMEATSLAMAGEGPAFALSRPAGHHATANVAMGFGLVNYAAAAVAARLAEAPDATIAILDWDVHHGNGVADIFKDEARVRYCSLHEVDNFPGTGLDEADRGPLGNLLNVPLPKETRSDAYLAALREKALPFLLGADGGGGGGAPELLLVCAGFDGLAADPLAKMELAPADFGASVRMIADEFGFPRERIALGLEGGYDLGDAGMPAAVVETAAALVER